MTIIITGGSHGLGACMAELLIQFGHGVQTPGRHVLDVTDPASIARFASECRTRIDVLINNAGGLCDGFDSHMALNARGPLLLTNALWPILKERKSRVINISSREGLSGDSFGNRLYSVSKAALNAVTRMQANNPDGVTVNACCPGAFDNTVPSECARAADTPIWMALEMDRSVNGKFFINREVVPW